MKTFIVKRKQLIIFILTLTLCAAVVINWYYTGRGNKPNLPEKEKQENLGEAKQVSADKSEAVEVSSASESYFTKAKLKRDAQTDESKEILTNIIKSKESGEASVRDAGEKLNRIIDNSKLQVDTENIISAKLNCECLVTINGESAEIMIPENKLDDRSAIQIKEVILSKADIKAEKISIIGVKNVVEN